MKVKIVWLLVVATTLGSFSGCMGKQNVPIKNESQIIGNADFSFNVEPETFLLEVESDGVSEIASDPLEKMQVTNLKQDAKSSSWSYAQQGIDVAIEKKEDYLDVTIKSVTEQENEFSWPKVSAKSYMLPMGQGKSIPANDELWKDHLSESEMSLLESFSMQFFAVEKEAYAIVYIIKNPYNNTMVFDTNQDIKFSFDHEYPSINPNKEYGFRIYVTPKNVVDVSKTYRNYIVEKGDFKTLPQKAQDNVNIEKLYGAPHVYFWDKAVISEENIKWNVLKQNLSKEVRVWIQQLLNTKVEDGAELAAAFDELMQAEFADKYIKSRVIKGFSQVLQLPEFYNEQVFTDFNKKEEALLEKGAENLNEMQLVALNKNVLKSALKDAVDPTHKWADANTIDVIQDMKNSGIDKMWMGFDDWRQGFTKPEFVQKANEIGYLIGTYDSYHSIHKPGEEQWITAKFNDTSLYENATVTKKNGEKLAGFQGTGRKLNPTLAMPSVKERVSSIMDTGVQFNSWFLDTDATGEVYDDYSPKYITTQEQDINARIERMQYLQKEWNMVIGTEGGNDFANSTIAFAHGIETPAFSWMDKDMAKNKDSEYYVGGYYAPNGGVPILFSKQIPLKDKYKQLFLDTKYTIPLYKLVYNDSVITTHWWGWGTLKLEDQIQDRMLYEVLYNVPPIYHIDKQEWQKHKDTIIEHTTVWSKFSEKAILQEMTDYKILSDDRTLQLTQYGKDLSVIANFSEQEAVYGDNTIKGKSLLILDGNNKINYSPR